jgi:hypothetical protein
MLLSHRPRHAVAVAYLALFVALGGTSYAALTITGKNVKNGSLTGADIKDASLRTADVKNGSLLGQDFKQGQLPAGPRGLTGQTGATGRPGQPGKPGSPAASVMTSHWLNNTIGGSYGPVMGIGPDTELTEAKVQQLSPAVTIVARDLVGRYERASDFPEGGTRTFTLRVNGADTALTCTLTRPAQSCANTSARVTIPPGSLISMRFSQGGGDVGSGDAVVGWRATTP